HEVRHDAFAGGVHAKRSGPDAAATEIGEHVPPAHLGNERTTIDVAAGNRITDGMIVFVDGVRERRERRSPRDVVVQPLPDSPSVVAPAGPARLVIDLLEAVLSDIADHERASAAMRDVIETE